MNGFVATAEIDVAAAPERVWSALTDPAAIQRYMFGTRVQTDWQPGSPITWSGEFQGRPYQDRGRILEVIPAERLTVTHFSPLSGKPDVPENYHTLVYELTGSGAGTRLRLSQDNNPSPDDAEHSRGMWEQMLRDLKQTVEKP